MKLISWNVNGIRAVWKKGFLDWFEQQDADLVAIQETKAWQDQLTEEQLHPSNYHSYWFSAQKKGYSSVALYFKKDPLSITDGLGIDEFDAEGRVVNIEYPEFTLVNAYFPNSQDGGKRIDYKVRFCQAMHKHLDKIKAQGKHVILCGDYNIAHKPIDLARPKANEGNAGYLPEERAWMDTFTTAGYVDIFRAFNQDPGQYTWWSYRAQARARNVGWRIDYFSCNPELKNRLKGMQHQDQVMGSDHCPIELNLKK
ncbi:MAG TPA: exodeoxyribonuclease III [Oligoflexia bacterium]|nr:exodeoxyribonuclease III [Oligoflexia bacterium]HMR25385.1 exodeoxyribonuclease III [Oligoflexia bacterium]